MIYDRCEDPQKFKFYNKRQRRKVEWETLWGEDLKKQKYILEDIVPIQTVTWIKTVNSLYGYLRLFMYV